MASQTKPTLCQAKTPGAVAKETDVNVLARRQKQIDYGKATEGYQNYLAAFPKENRSGKQPRTPNKYKVCSRRNWDGQIKVWRLLLHAYDNDRNSSADNSVYSLETSMFEETSYSSMEFMEECYSTYHNHN